MEVLDPNKKCLVLLKENFAGALRNAADYHLGLVKPSTADRASQEEPRGLNLTDTVSVPSKSFRRKTITKLSIRFPFLSDSNRFFGGDTIKKTSTKTLGMKQMEKWTNGQTDRWTNRQTDKWTNGQTNKLRNQTKDPRRSNDKTETKKYLKDPSKIEADRQTDRQKK